MDFKWIIETVYKIVKGYMVKRIADTGNQEFINNSNGAFKMIEGIWAQVIAKAEVKK